MENNLHKRKVTRKRKYQFTTGTFEDVKNLLESIELYSLENVIGLFVVNADFNFREVDSKYTTFIVVFKDNSLELRQKVKQILNDTFYSYKDIIFLNYNNGENNSFTIKTEYFYIFAIAYCIKGHSDYLMQSIEYEPCSLSC